MTSVLHTNYIQIQHSTVSSAITRHSQASLNRSVCSTGTKTMWMDQCAGDQGDQSDLQRNKTNTESQTPKTGIGQRSRAAFEIGSDSSDP